jgi:hypothetical protein
MLEILAKINCDALGEGIIKVNKLTLLGDVYYACADIPLVEGHEYMLESEDLFVSHVDLMVEGKAVKCYQNCDNPHHFVLDLEDGYKEVEYREVSYTIGTTKFTSVDASVSE